MPRFRRPVAKPQVLRSAIVRHSDGRDTYYYRADITDRVKGSYAGAVNQTFYYERHESDPRASWREITYLDIPKPAYRRLREKLRAADDRTR